MSFEKEWSDVVERRLKTLRQSCHESKRRLASIESQADGALGGRARDSGERAGNQQSKPSRRSKSGGVRAPTPKNASPPSPSTSNTSTSPTALLTRARQQRESIMTALNRRAAVTGGNEGRGEADRRAGGRFKGFERSLEAAAQSIREEEQEEKEGTKPDERPLKPSLYCDSGVSRGESPGPVCVRSAAARSVSRRSLKRVDFDESSSESEGRNIGRKGKRQSEDLPSRTSSPSLSPCGQCSSNRARAEAAVGAAEALRARVKASHVALGRLEARAQHAEAVAKRDGADFEERQTALNEELIRANDEAVTERRSRSEIERKLGKLRKEIESRERSHRKQIEELSNEIGEVSSDLQHSTDEISKQKDECTRFRDENDLVKRELKSMKTARDSAKSDTEQALLHAEDLEMEHGRLLGRLEESASRVSQLEAEIAKGTDETERQTQTLLSYRKHHSLLSDEVQSLKSELLSEKRSAGKKIDDAQTLISRLQAKHKADDVALDTHRATIESLRSEKEMLVDLLKEEEENHAGVKSKLSVAEARATELDARANELESRVAGLTEGLSGARRDLQSSREATKDLENSLVQDRSESEKILTQLEECRTELKREKQISEEVRKDLESQGREFESQLSLTAEEIE
eukprot:914721_1